MSMQSDLAYIDKATDELLRQRKVAVEALREIAKGEGPYSRDPLTHAENTIENLVSIATEALVEIESARRSDQEEADRG